MMRRYSARRGRIRAARKAAHDAIHPGRLPTIVEEGGFVWSTRASRRPVVRSLAHWAAIHNAG